MKANINVDIIVQSEHDQKEIDVAFSVQESEKDATIELLEWQKIPGLCPVDFRVRPCQGVCSGDGHDDEAGGGRENVCHAE